MANHDIPETTKQTQASNLLKALLEHGGLTTTTIREVLGFCHPAGRINELRALGHKVSTTIVWAADSEGRQHKQALYTLMPQVLWALLPQVTNHD